MFAMYDKQQPEYMGWNKGQPYVAKIDGFDCQRGEFSKVYKLGYNDFSQANSKGSRGIYKLYFVDDGLYEIVERKSWRKIEQYYLLIADGKKHRMNLEEAIGWLEANTKNELG
jgi:hypothetical protein